MGIMENKMETIIMGSIGFRVWGLKVVEVSGFRVQASMGLCKRVLSWGLPAGPRSLEATSFFFMQSKLCKSFPRH